MSPAMADSVEKVGVSTQPNFFSAGARFSDADAGDLIIHLRLNGACSKSICGGNQRQSKMSFVFWQVCNDFRLATFSTESALSVVRSAATSFLKLRHERTQRGHRCSVAIDPPETLCRPGTIAPGTTLTEKNRPQYGDRYPPRPLLSSGWRDDGSGRCP